MSEAPRRCGPYELRALLARGGFGAVYRAWDPRVGREVALKLLERPPGAGASRRRFQREVEALARLRHRHVVAIHDAGEDEAGRPFLVMDLVQGESLEARLKSAGPLPGREAAAMVAALAEGLSHAHAQGVLHRDLKPANVLIDEDGLARLTDFGLARELDGVAAGTRLTQDGVVLGTPGYWPPEQALGELDRVGPASDVYGLGAILYAALTGHPPQDVGEGGPAAWGVAAVAPPRPPSSAGVPVPAALDAICLRALAPAPEGRYPDVAALADDLGRFLRGAPVRALSDARGRGGAALRRAGALALLAGLALWAALAGKPRVPAAAALPPSGEGGSQRPSPAALTCWARLDAESVRDVRALPGLEAFRPWGIGLLTARIRFRATDSGPCALRLPIAPGPGPWRLVARLEVVYLDGGSFSLGLGEGTTVKWGIRLSTAPTGKPGQPPRGRYELLPAPPGEPAPPGANRGSWSATELELIWERSLAGDVRLTVLGERQEPDALTLPARPGAAPPELIVGAQLDPGPPPVPGSTLDVRLDSLELWGPGPAPPLPLPDVAEASERQVSRLLTALVRDDGLPDLGAALKRLTPPPPAPSPLSPPDVLAQACLEARLDAAGAARDRLNNLLLRLELDRTGSSAELRRLGRSYFPMLRPVERRLLAGVHFQLEGRQTTEDTLARLRAAASRLEQEGQRACERWAEAALLFSFSEAGEALAALDPGLVGEVAFRAGDDDEALRWLTDSGLPQPHARALGALAALRHGDDDRARDLCREDADEAGASPADRRLLERARALLDAR